MDNLNKKSPEMGGGANEEVEALKAKLLTILDEYRTVAKIKAAFFGTIAANNNTAIAKSAPLPSPEPNGSVKEVVVNIPFFKTTFVDITNSGMGAISQNTLIMEGGDGTELTVDGLSLEIGKSYSVIVYEVNRKTGSVRTKVNFIFDGENPNSLRIIIRTPDGTAADEKAKLEREQLLTTFGEQKLKLQTLSNEWRDAAEEAVDAEFKYIKGELIKALKAMKVELAPAMWKDAVLKAGNFTAAKILEFITGAVIAWRETKTTKDWVKIAIAFGKRNPQFFLLACAFDVGVGLVFDAFVTAPVLEDPVKAENERLQEEWYKYVDEQVAKVYNTAQVFKNNIKSQADKFIGTLLALKEPKELNYEQGKLMLENAKKIVEAGHSVPRYITSSLIVQDLLKNFPKIPFGTNLFLEEEPIQLDPLPKGNVSAFMDKPFSEIGFDSAFVYQRFETEGRKLLDWVRASPSNLVDFSNFKAEMLKYWYDNSTWLNFDKHITDASAFAKFIYETVDDKDIKTVKNPFIQNFPSNAALLKATNNNENLVAHFKATNNAQQEIVYKMGKSIQLAQYLANPQIANVAIEIKIADVAFTDNLATVFKEDDYRKLKLSKITWRIEFDYQELAIVENTNSLMKAAIESQKPEWFATKKATITGTKIWQ